MHFDAIFYVLLLFKIHIKLCYYVSIVEGSTPQNYEWRPGKPSCYSGGSPGPGLSGVWTPVGARFSTTFQTDPEARTALCTGDNGSLSLGQSGRFVTLTILHHTVPRLCIGGATPPPSPFAFMARCYELFCNWSKFINISFNRILIFSRAFKWVLLLHFSFHKLSTAH